MKKIYFLFLAFSSLFSEVIFIMNDAISSINATNLYVYLLLNIQNNDIKNSIYLNNENNLYANNSITFNGNTFFQKLPLFNIGNYFLVLDENNSLGIYYSLMIPKNKILKDSYNSITTDIILNEDNNGLLIQDDLYNNIIINATDKVNFNGKSIFINNTINTSNREINIYNLDKTDMIAIPFDIDANNIEYKGIDLAIPEIDMKNFFSYNNVINIFTNMLFTKATVFNSNSNVGNISFLNNDSNIELSKDLLLPNIDSLNIQDNIICLVIDGNYIKKSSFFLKKNTIVSPLNTDILIGNDKTSTCNIIFNKSSSPLNTKLTINNIIIGDFMLLGKDSINIESHIINLDMNNFWNRYNIDKCYIQGPGTININSITNFDSIVFNGKVILDSNSGIDVTKLSTVSYSDSVKQLVMVNQDGLLGYISNPKDNRYYTTEIEDTVLYDNLIELYTLHYNDIKLKNNFENNNIIKSIKNIFNKKQNSELFNRLFQYDQETDLLYYNPIFAEELLKNKTNALDESLPTPTDKITHKKIKKIEQEVDNALKKIKNSIEEILSIDTLQTGKII